MVHDGRIAMEELEERRELVDLLKKSVEKALKRHEQRRKRRFINSKPPELFKSIRDDYPRLVQSYEENKVIWM